MHLVVGGAFVGWMARRPSPVRSGLGGVAHALCVAPHPVRVEVEEPSPPPSLPAVVLPGVVVPELLETPVEALDPDLLAEPLVPQGALPPPTATLMDLAERRMRRPRAAPSPPPGLRSPPDPGSPPALTAQGPSTAPAPGPLGRPAPRLRPLHDPRPPVPSWLRLTQELVVGLAFTVEAGGVLSDVRIARSSGQPWLDEEVRAFVERTWRFEPPGTPRRARRDILFRPAGG